MKRNKIDKIILIMSIIVATIEIGITIGYCMLTNIDFDKYNNYNVEIVK